MRSHVPLVAEFFQFFFNRIHERDERLVVETEMRARRFKQFGQRARAAQRERGPIALHSLAIVLAAAQPDLQRADLRDSIVDEIEGNDEKVENAMPGT